MNARQRSSAAAKRQRQRAARDRRVAQRRAAARRQRTIWVLGVVALLAAVAGGIFALARGTGPVDEPEGVVDIDETGRDHVTGPVAYANDPPAGGDHAGIWQNCGFYDEPVANENAVHSLEHGAVWIQYAEDAPAATVDLIRDTVQDRGFVLASPFAELDVPVVLSAWGKQLRLDDPTDPRFEQFLDAFVQGPQTPEPGARCDGGVGEPLAP